MSDTVIETKPAGDHGGGIRSAGKFKFAEGYT
jgi:hypothetical protein